MAFQNRENGRHVDISSSGNQPQFPPLPKNQNHADKKQEMNGVKLSSQNSETQNELLPEPKQMLNLPSQSQNNPDSRLHMNEDFDMQVNTAPSTESQEGVSAQRNSEIKQENPSNNLKPTIPDGSSDQHGGKSKKTASNDIKKVEAEKSKGHNSRDVKSSHDKKKKSEKDKRRSNSRKRSRSRKSRSHRRDKDRRRHKSSRSKGKKSHRHHKHSRNHKKRYTHFQTQSYYRRQSSDSDSSSSSRSASKSSSSSSEDSRKRKSQKKPFNSTKNKKTENIHPYFQKKKGEEVEIEKPKLFWDGFQWVTRQQQVFDVAQDAVKQAQKAVTGEDEAKHEERIAASKTVIIENIALDLGLTARDLQKFLLENLESLGERDVVIVDIDMNNGPSSIAVELLEKSMVDKMKKLDGILCLGEKLKVRRVNEETASTNIQAAVITLHALKSLTSGNADSELNLKTNTLKTVNDSSVIKISNLFDREEELTPEVYEELYDDMEAEFTKIPHLKRIKIIRNGEERLGAEVGSIFVEFRDKKSADIGLKMMRGRIYDGREIKSSFIDEKLYYNELYIA